MACPERNCHSDIVREDTIRHHVPEYGNRLSCLPRRDVRPGHGGSWNKALLGHFIEQPARVIRAAECGVRGEERRREVRADVEEACLEEEAVDGGRRQVGPMHRRRERLDEAEGGGGEGEWVHGRRINTAEMQSP